MIIPAGSDKPTAIKAVGTLITDLGLTLGPTDYDKPWGAYFYIDPAGIDTFIAKYFPDFPADQLQRFGAQLQPKYLLIEPGKRFSWQYHYRRGEIWRIVQGPVGMERSADDTEPAPTIMQGGEIVAVDTKVRHRLCGLENWALIAEVWQHTDAAHLSDEADVVRVADDYNR